MTKGTGIDRRLLLRGAALTGLTAAAGGWNGASRRRERRGLPALAMLR